MSAYFTSPDKFSFPRSPEPFPEPQTFPAGWDLSEMLSPAKPEPVDQSPKPVPVKKTKKSNGRVKGSA